jgi:hypothetical protein
MKVVPVLGSGASAIPLLIISYTEVTANNQQ